MIFEEYFEDINKVSIDFNGELIKLSDYDKKRKSIVTLVNRNIAEYANLKLYYDGELAGQIEGYILDLGNKYDEDSLVIYEDDIYWILDDIWDDLGTLFTNILDKKYSINEKYFLIKNIKSTVLFKDEIVEIFLLDSINDFINKFLKLNIDYLVLMADTSKLIMNKEEIHMGVRQGIKNSIIKVFKGVKNAGKEVQIQNISSLAKKYNFYKIETNNKKIKIWVKDIDY